MTRSSNGLPLLQKKG